MIAIIDYGMGNLRSVQKALERMGAQTVITQDPNTIHNAAKIVLPGVGAMQPAMEKLHRLALLQPIKDGINSGKPFLGICLGLQLLFEKSCEGGDVQGIGILPGTVERFQQLKVPHMGWNQLKIIKSNCPILTGISEPASVYFCHSYYVKPKNPETILTTTEYGINFVSAVWKDNLYAVQFHPEKSQTIGLKILENFTRL
jgi:imidazole glycerol-phosphate synthase subunit HisH